MRNLQLAGKTVPLIGQGTWRMGEDSHVRLNARAATLELDSEDLARLDQAFPPPTRKQRLKMV